MPRAALTVLMLWALPATLLALAVLAGCSSSANRAPVEDRGVTTAPRIDPTTLPGAENAGKPGFYTVRQGDTIMKIATEVNQPWRDIVRWNNLDNPNVIEVGQVLRVVAPVGTTLAAARGGAHLVLLVGPGEPAPATTRVVQIEPAPTPTLITSAPASINASVPSAVTTLPARIIMSGQRCLTRRTVSSTPRV